MSFNDNNNDPCEFLIEVSNRQKLQQQSEATPSVKTVIPTEFDIDLPRMSGGAIDKYRRRSTAQLFKVNLLDLVIPNEYIIIDQNTYSQHSASNTFDQSTDIVNNNSISNTVDIIDEGGDNEVIYDEALVFTGGSGMTATVYSCVDRVFLLDSTGAMLPNQTATFNELPSITGGISAPTFTTGNAPHVDFRMRIGQIIITSGGVTPITSGGRVVILGDVQSDVRAVGELTVDAGAIISGVKLLNHGRGYTNKPTLEFYNGGTKLLDVTYTIDLEIDKIILDKPGSMYTNTDDQANFAAGQMRLLDGAAVTNAYLGFTWKVNTVLVTNPVSLLPISGVTATSATVVANTLLTSLTALTPTFSISKESQQLFPYELPYLYVSISDQKSANFFSNNINGYNKQFRVIVDDESQNRKNLIFRSCQMTSEIYMDVNDKMTFAITTPNGNPLLYKTLTVSEGASTSSRIRTWEWDYKEVSALFKFQTVNTADKSEVCFLGK